MMILNFIFQVFWLKTKKSFRWEADISILDSYCEKSCIYHVFTSYINMA